MSDEVEVRREELIPDARNELLQRARRGELAPQEAERDAERLGLEPLAYQPRDGLFDPARKSRWRLAMVLAWIVWRDNAQVRAWDTDYRRECWDWQSFPVRLSGDDGSGVKSVEGWAIQQRSPGSAILFESFGHIPLGGDQTTFLPPDEPELAKKELWNRLLDGDLAADALPTGGGRRLDIPARDWSDLEYCTGRKLDADYLRYRGRPLHEAYSDVLWRRVDVVRIWPPHGPADIAKDQAKAMPRLSAAEADRQWGEWVAALQTSGQFPSRHLASIFAADRDLPRHWWRSKLQSLPEELRLKVGHHQKVKSAGK